MKLNIKLNYIKWKKLANQYIIKFKTKSDNSELINTASNTVENSVNSAVKHINRILYQIDSETNNQFFGEWYNTFN